MRVKQRHGSAHGIVWSQPAIAWFLMSEEEPSAANGAPPTTQATGRGYPRLLEFI
jgi:hypothetical protein